MANRPQGHPGAEVEGGVCVCFGGAQGGGDEQVKMFKYFCPSENQFNRATT